MRTFSIALSLCFTLIMNSIYAETDYFPLAVGNKWIYEYHSTCQGARCSYASINGIIFKTIVDASIKEDTIFYTISYSSDTAFLSYDTLCFYNNRVAYDNSVRYLINPEYYFNDTVFYKNQNYDYLCFKLDSCETTYFNYHEALLCDSIKSLVLNYRREIGISWETKTEIYINNIGQFIDTSWSQDWTGKFIQVSTMKLKKATINNIVYEIINDEIVTIKDDFKYSNIDLLFKILYQNHSFQIVSDKYILKGITMYGINGNKLISQYNVNNSKIAIVNTNGIKPGIYFMELICVDSNRYNRKLFLIK